VPVFDGLLVVVAEVSMTDLDSMRSRADLAGIGLVGTWRRNSVGTRGPPARERPRATVSGA